MDTSFTNCFRYKYVKEELTGFKISGLSAARIGRVYFGISWMIGDCVPGGGSGAEQSLLHRRRRWRSSNLRVWVGFLTFDYEATSGASLVLKRLGLTYGFGFNLRFNNNFFFSLFIFLGINNYCCCWLCVSEI